MYAINYDRTDYLNGYPKAKVHQGIPSHTDPNIRRDDQTDGWWEDVDQAPPQGALMTSREITFIVAYCGTAGCM